MGGRSDPRGVRSPYGRAAVEPSTDRAGRDLFRRGDDDRQLSLLRARGDPPARPGLAKRAPRSGAFIAVELWSPPLEKAGSFMQDILVPLGIGTVDLSDGWQANGFIGEAEAVTDGTDST